MLQWPPPQWWLSQTLMVLGAEVQLLAEDVADLKGEDVSVVEGVDVAEDIVRIAGLQELLLGKDEITEVARIQPQNIQFAAPFWIASWKRPRKGSEKLEEISSRKERNETRNSRFFLSYNTVASDMWLRLKIRLQKLVKEPIQPQPKLNQGLFMIKWSLNSCYCKNCWSISSEWYVFVKTAANFNYPTF